MRITLLIAVTIALCGCAAPRGIHSPPAADTSETAEPERAITVIVWGEVRAPDTYTFPAGTHLREAIDRAAGFSPYAARHHVTIKRADKLYVYDLHPHAETHLDPLLHDGDLVLVPSGTPVW